MSLSQVSAGKPGWSRSRKKQTISFHTGIGLFFSMQYDVS
jgi:hypothetical protein